jgi:hypothetical protein
MNPLNDQGLYEIYSVWHVPFWQTRSFYLIIATLIVLSTVVAVVLLIRWYRKKQGAAQTSWQQALAQLATLQHRHYATKEEGKACYFAMTSILKEYLARRFDYPLPGKTDEEMVQYLAHSAHPQLAHAIKPIIEGCVHIKFANEQALEQTIKKHLEQCGHIITSTIPTPAENNKKLSHIHQ